VTNPDISGTNWRQIQTLVEQIGDKYTH